MLCSLKTQASLIYPPEQLAAACVYFAYIAMGLEPLTPDGSTFCEFAKTPVTTLEGEATDSNSLSAQLPAGCGLVGPSRVVLPALLVQAPGRPFLCVN